MASTNKTNRALTRLLMGTAALAMALTPSAYRPSVQAAEAKPQSMERFFSVTGHFLHNNRFYPGTGPYWEVQRTLPLVRELGVNRVHEAIYALGAQPRALVSNNGKNKPAALDRNRQQLEDWLKVYDDAGISVTLAVLGYAPTDAKNIGINAEFRDWVADLLSRHKSVDTVQLHNEPNLTSYWPKATAKDYVDVYRDYAKAIKAKRPDIKILGGAASALMWHQSLTWMQQAADAGLFDFVDGIAVHPYNVDQPPEVDPHWTAGVDQGGIDRVAALQTYYDKVLEWTKGRRVPLYFTEFGWNTATGGRAHVDEQTQAAYLLRSYLIFLDARAKGVPIEAASWYDLKDDGQKPEKGEHNFGLVSFDLKRRKPSFNIMKSLVAEVGKLGEVAEDKSPLVTATCAGDVKTVSLAGRTGARLAAVWNVAANGGMAEHCSLALDAGNAVLTRFDEAGNPKTQPVAGNTEIDIGAMPVLVAKTAP